MQYSPKLKRIAEEINAILAREDIAAVVVLHQPGFSEFISRINPSYSCAQYDLNGSGVMIKTTHIKSKAEKQQKIVDTSNMLMHLSLITGQEAVKLLDCSTRLDKICGVKHSGGGHTSHNQQNN